MSGTVAWEQALDALEADLVAAEELASTGVGAIRADWVPPTLDEPLPEELRTRAIELHERQLDLRERLPGLITRTARQLEMARKVSTRSGAHSSNPRSAIYIDTTA